MGKHSLVHILAYMAAKYGGPPQVASALGLKTEQIFDWNIQYLGTGTSEDRIEVAQTGLQIKLFDTKWPNSWFYSPDLIGHMDSLHSSLDILHIHEIWSHPQFAAARQARLSDIPYIITPHGELEPWRLRRKGYKKKPYMKLFGHKMLDGAQCLHAITRFEVDGFRRAGFKGAVTVVPNGVNPEDYRDLPSSEVANLEWPKLKDKRIILFLSRLSKEKGLDLLLAAWKEVQRGFRGKDAVLVLAGPDDRGYSGIVTDMIDRYDLHSSVTRTGMVTGDRKNALLSRADIFILPSYSEGFSISILENMAVGNPLIITEGCNFPEVSEHQAGLCVNNEAGKIGDAINIFLEKSDSELQRMGASGKKLVEREYTWDIACKKMMTVYQCILEGKAIPFNPEPIREEN